MNNRRGWVSIATVAFGIALAPAVLVQPVQARPMIPPPPDGDPLPDDPGGPYADPPPDGPYSEPPPPPQNDMPRPPPPDDYRPVPVPSQPEVFERRGWFAGFDLGLGSLTMGDRNANESFGGVAFGGLFGGMLSDRFGLMVLLSAGGFPDSDNDAAYGLTSWGLGAQFWVADKLWLRGGFATTSLSVSQNGDEVGNASGRSLLGGVGYELSRSTSFVFDVQGRIDITSYKDQPGDCCRSSLASIHAGFSWY